ncbi:rust resistance kinase Lr10-like [Magnolia sinica]|uniref:rust resistance kinase Lr10-like n=1 Tax=Magnolia sinica TaxID=86752 RepID=UPI00265825BE|nr:rust resistance kinase Lr10-like [Magnolia sinica]
MGMLQSIFLIQLILSISLEIGTCEGDCTPASCGLDEPEIRNPFRLVSQPQRCGQPEFELACRGNQTVLNLPSSKQEINVTSIDYETGTLLISYQDNCLMSLLFNLNLSASPYTYYPFSIYYGQVLEPIPDYYLDSVASNFNYTLVDCSVDIASRVFDGLACLDRSGHHFYIVNSAMFLSELPNSCKPIKSGTIPITDDPDFYMSSYFPYSNERPYLFPNYTDGTYGPLPPVRLRWNVPGCSKCRRRGGRCTFKNETSNETTCFFPPPPPPPFDIGEYYSFNGHEGLSRKSVIAGVSIGFFLLVIATMTSIKVYTSWKSKRLKETENQQKVEKFLENYKSLNPTRYTYSDIKKITNQFKCKLGQGGYGTVYKGNLPNGVSVAVKILKRSSAEGGDFINEVGTIGMIHHVNVVRLLGFCADGFERALIYEFMPNESLEKFIFSKDNKNPSLGWEMLQNIAIGIARGIEYLHQGCDQRILHFDIKPHNILLDQNFNPKITDFGLAKLCSKEQSIVSMSAAKGTMGYIAPELFSRNFGNVSYKSDVYSFGMVLLEMVGGRKNTDVNAENSSRIYFPEWIYNRLHQGEEIELKIIEEEDSMIVKKLSIVALWCIQWYPVDRPSMKSVIQMLEGSMESLIMPPNPFGSTSQPEASTSFPKNSQSKLEVIVE